MTKKIYYEDNWLESCKASVLECKKVEGGYAVLLDRTVIFPEGGGQPSDHGFIENAAVTYAQEQGGEIWHMTAVPFQKGDAVNVRVDLERRRDHSQQHTGEHILSGLASTLFQTKNVGFHMAEDYSTIDLDQPLSDEQLTILFEQANRVVQSNIPVTYKFVEAEALDGIELRKRANGLKGEVRIVYIGDVDSCTCCGTHCKSTGEVGYIMASAWQNYKGGTRLWFLCGMRAVRAAEESRKTVGRLAKRFSCKIDDVQNAVFKQGDELSLVKKEMKERSAALMRYKAAELLDSAETVNSVKLIVSLEECFTPGEIRLFSEVIVKKEPAIALLFTVQDESLYYVMCADASCGFSMRELCETVNAVTGGRGGGKDGFAQGSAKLSSGINETITQIKAYLCTKIKNMP